MEIFSGRLARQLLWVFVIVFTGFSAAGIVKLNYDDNYHNLFRSEHAFFEQFEDYKAEFSLDENDFVILASADEILSEANLGPLFRLDQSLRDSEFVDSVFSLFSVQTLDEENYGEALYPGIDASYTEHTEFRKSIKQHPLSSRVLLSEDHDATVFIVTLAGDQLSVSEIEPIYAELISLTGEYSSSNLEIQISGIPALRTVMVRSTQRDQAVFQGLGVLLCILLGFLMFRSLAAVIVTNVSAIIGPVWALGMMGHLGIGIDPVNVIAPTLLLILCFADSVHMASHVRERMAEGDSNQVAVVTAVREVGPACVMTAMTTIVAFLSLSLFSNTTAIQRFGVIGAGGMLAVLLAVLIVVPLLSVLLLKPATKQLDGSWNTFDRWMQKLISVTASWSIRLAMPVTVIALGFLVLCVKFAFELPANYRYADHIPGNNAAYKALLDTEQKMGGGLPLRVFIDLPAEKEQGLASEQVVGVLFKIHQILQQEPTTHGPFSLLNLLNSMPETMTLEEKVDEA